MVVLNVKHLNESLFLQETTLESSVDDTLEAIVRVHNGCCKVLRLCSHIEDLARHGVALPPNMQGLLAEQILGEKT